MVMYSERQLNRVFSALADPTRRRMLSMLARRERTAGDLGEPFRISQPAASKHIRILRRAGLVSRQIQGRTHRFTFQAKPLEEAEKWIAQHRKFWESSLESLGRMLEEIQRGEQ